MTHAQRFSGDRRSQEACRAFGHGLYQHPEVKVSYANHTVLSATDRIDRQIRVRMESLLCVTFKNRLEAGRVSEAEDTKTKRKSLLVLHHKSNLDILWRGCGCANDSERFGKHALKTRVCMQVHGGHKTFKWDERTEFQRHVASELTGL